MLSSLHILVCLSICFVYICLLFLGDFVGLNITYIVGRSKIDAMEKIYEVFWLWGGNWGEGGRETGGG